MNIVWSLLFILFPSLLFASATELVPSIGPFERKFFEVSIKFVDSESGLSLLGAGLEDGVQEGMRACLLSKDEKTQSCSPLIGVTARSSQARFRKQASVGQKVRMYALPHQVPMNMQYGVSIGFFLGYEPFESGRLQIPYYSANALAEGRSGIWEEKDLSFDNYGSTGWMLSLSFWNRRLEWTWKQSWHVLIPREVQLDLPQVFEDPQAYGKLSQRLEIKAISQELNWLSETWAGSFGLGLGLEWSETNLDYRFLVTKADASSALLARGLLRQQQLSPQLQFLYQKDLGSIILGVRANFLSTSLSQGGSRLGKLLEDGSPIPGFSTSEAAFEESLSLKNMPRKQIQVSFGYRL